MRNLFLVGVGGLLGSIFRFLLSPLIQSNFLSSFPYGTLGVNVIGSLIIGFIVGLSEKFNLSIEWRLFLATGICGGFTTFSAFSIETFGMLRDGQLLPAFAYIFFSIFLGLASAFTGFLLLRFI